MSFPGHARVSIPTPPAGMPMCPEPSASDAPGFHLPILARSAALLQTLLQDAIIDLELASSVITLDPGLAYQVLRLANRNVPDDRDRIWQLPLAIVTAGRANLDELLDRSVQLEPAGSRKSVIQSLITEAVLRACLAHSLARELGSSSPRKCFLSGLLFDLPALVQLSVPARLDSHARLLSDMCHSLPVTIVRAALAQVASAEGPTDPVVAIVSMAQKLLHAGGPTDSRIALAELAEHSLWRPWAGLPVLQRSKILQRCSELVGWAGKNLYHLHPWDFLEQMESYKPCE